MSVFFFGKSELFKEHVKQVSSSVVPSGLMGLIGNKGAVAIDFRLFCHKYIVVSSHLAAHEQYYSRRNYDLRRNLQTIVISPSNNSENLLLEDEIFDELISSDIEHCDFCFWMGDLNYRVEMESSKARQLLAQKKYDELIGSDQLNRAIQLGDAFEGFKEGPILFPPTFKYNVGTSKSLTLVKNFGPLLGLTESSGKKISALRLKAYWNALDVTISDHKPVAAMFILESLKIDSALLSKVYKEVLKEIDSIENAAIPLTFLDPSLLNIGQIHFGISKFRIDPHK